MRRGPAVLRGLLVALALAGAGAAGVFALRRAPLRAAVSSPETQVKDALRATGPVRLDVAGVAVVLERLRFPDVAVWPDEAGAGVIAMVEAEGRVEAPFAPATLTYVGREQFRVERAGAGRWKPVDSPVPALEGVLRTLLARAEAFRAGDAGAYAPLVSKAWSGPGGTPALLARLRSDLRGPRPSLRIRAWQIRIERGRATAGEDQEVEVGGAPPARLRARYDLALEDGRWRIIDGL